MLEACSLNPEAWKIMALIDKKKLALIHIVKKELRLSDAEYRQILKEVAGVSSAKEIDDRGFRKLMRYFFRNKNYHVNPAGLTMKQKIYIKRLANQLSWTDGHLVNFIKKYYHKEKIESLTRKEAIKLIESLKNVDTHKRP